MTRIRQVASGQSSGENLKLRQNGTLSIQMENKASSPPAMMIVAWTPQTSTTAPQPMAAKGCTPIVTMLNSPRMADLRSGGARSCTADEEVTRGKK